MSQLSPDSPGAAAPAPSPSLSSAASGSSPNAASGPLSVRQWGRTVEVEHALGGTGQARPLLLLDAEMRAPLNQSPRPFLHPLRTLGGLEASDFAPPDHAWHHGLSLTCAALDHGAEPGKQVANFWGGPTYERGRGYVPLDNHGRQEPGPPTLRIEGAQGNAPGPGATLTQSVRWTLNGELLLEEERALQVLALPSARAWRLGWSSRLRNVSGRTLRWGSPTTQGRPNAGYGGLFWRGPRGLQASHVAFLARSSSTSGEVKWLSRDEEMMGHPMSAGEDLLFRARGQDGAFVLACEAMQAHQIRSAGQAPARLDWELQWFARTSVPMVAWAFCFSRERAQEPGQTWLLQHRLALLDLSAEEAASENVHAGRLREIWSR